MLKETKEFKLVRTLTQPNSDLFYYAHNLNVTVNVRTKFHWLKKTSKVTVFGPSADVAKYMQILNNKGIYNGEYNN